MRGYLHLEFSKEGGFARLDGRSIPVDAGLEILNWRARMSDPRDKRKPIPLGPVGKAA